MFSRDIKHYRKVPRSMAEAFGPYTNDLLASCSERPLAERAMDVIGAVSAVVIVGAVIGLLLGWQG